MANTGALYPYDAKTNPTGYKPGSLEEKKALLLKANAPKTSDKPLGVGTVLAQSAGIPAMTDEYNQPVADGQLYIYNPKTKQNVLTSIGTEYGKAFSNIKYLAFIRKELVKYGQLSPKIKDKTAVLKAFTNALVGASTNKMDLAGYMKQAQALGFGYTGAAGAASKAGTSIDKFTQTLSSAEVKKTIDDTVMTTIGRKATAEETAQFTALIKNIYEKGQTTKTVTDAKGNTKTTRTAGYDPNVAAAQIAEQVKLSSPKDYERQQGLSFFDWMQKAESMRGGR